MGRCRCRSRAKTEEARDPSDGGTSRSRWVPTRRARSVPVPAPRCARGADDAYVRSVAPRGVWSTPTLRAASGARAPSQDALGERRTGHSLGESKAQSSQRTRHARNAPNFTNAQNDGARFRLSSARRGASPQSPPAGTRRCRTAACLPAAGSRMSPRERRRSGKASPRLSRAHTTSRKRPCASRSRRRESSCSVRSCASARAAGPPPAAWTRCSTRWRRRDAGRRSRSCAPTSGLPRALATTPFRSGASSDRDRRATEARARTRTTSTSSTGPRTSTTGVTFRSASTASTRARRRGGWSTPCPSSSSFSSRFSSRAPRLSPHSRGPPRRS